MTSRKHRLFHTFLQLLNMVESLQDKSRASIVCQSLNLAEDRVCERCAVVSCRPASISAQVSAQESISRLRRSHSSASRCSGVLAASARFAMRLA